MNAAYLFLTFVAVVRPMDDTTVQQRYLAVHHVWQDLHQAGEREEKPVSALLVFDPRKAEIRVESDGKIVDAHVESLPRGFEWSAYVITTRGISPIPFPVRISTPKRDSESESDTEQIWIIGANKTRQWQFDISGTKNGHSFHIGSGTLIGTAYHLNLPEVDPGMPDVGTTSSILDPETERERKWSDTIRTEWFSIDILRTKSP